MNPIYDHGSTGFDPDRTALLYAVAVNPGNPDDEAFAANGHGLAVVRELALLLPDGRRHDWRLRPAYLDDALHKASPGSSTRDYLQGLVALWGADARLAEDVVPEFAEVARRYELRAPTLIPMIRCLQRLYDDTPFGSPPFRVRPMSRAEYKLFYAMRGRRSRDLLH